MALNVVAWADNAPLRLFVGCSTDAKHVHGLHAVELDTATGRAKVVESYAVPNATYQSFSPDGRIMYSVTSGGLVSFRVEGGRLVELDRHDCKGSPCHVSTMPDGLQVNWADYGGGTAGSVKVRDGRFVGGDERYAHGAKSHCHQAVPTPDGRRFCVVDLGLDSITTYPEGKVFHTDPTGAGPRHMVFHRNGQLAFAVFELGNLLASYRWQAETGLSPLDSKTTIPGGDGHRNGRDYASAIRFTPDGRRLVVTNRGEESLAVFDFDERTGALALRSRTKLPGSWPRDFAFVTSDLGMVTMERTGQVHTVRYDAEKGEFTLVSSLEGLFRPASISAPGKSRHAGN